MKIITDYQRDSTYLPYRLRSQIFNPIILPIYILGRAFSYFWLDKIYSILGLGTLIILIPALTKRQNLLALLAIFVGAIAGSLPRHPNSTGFYFLLLPVFVDLIHPIINKNSWFLLISMVLLNIIGQIL